MIAVTVSNGNRQELHGTAASAVNSAKRWNAIGFVATIEFCDSFDNQLTVVHVATDRGKWFWCKGCGSMLKSIGESQPVVVMSPSVFDSFKILAKMKAEHND